MTAKELQEVRERVLKSKPLIHCITNPISINDCANAVLAVGAQPIMAEHPSEVAGIVTRAGALLCNLGNITDVRLSSMRIAGETAHVAGIPIVLDLVGVGASPLRLSFAQKFASVCRPTVIKGNRSELRAFGGLPTRAGGVDAAAEDCAADEDEALQKHFTALAKKYGVVIFATGETDCITDGKKTLLLRNGHPLLARVTGSGCVVGALTAAYASQTDGMTAAALATAMLGVSAELAAGDARGPGSFRVYLMDYLSALDGNTLSRRLRLEEICNEV